MISVQEELDWECYRLYGLIEDDLTYGGDDLPLALGERAFEIVLARAVEAGEETAWFTRQSPITDPLAGLIGGCPRSPSPPTLKTRNKRRDLTENPQTPYAATRPVCPSAPRARPPDLRRPALRPARPLPPRPFPNFGPPNRILEETAATP